MKQGSVVETELEQEYSVLWAQPQTPNFRQMA